MLIFKTIEDFSSFNKKLDELLSEFDKKESKTEKIEKPLVSPTKNKNTLSKKG